MRFALALLLCFAVTIRSTLMEVTMGLRIVAIAPTIALIIVSLVPSRLPGQGLESSGVPFSEVRSVFRKRCLTCHNPEETRGDLDLSSLETIGVGGGSGPVVVPGKPEESLIYTASAHLEDPVMPPNSPRIPGRELDLIKRWIESMNVESFGNESIPSTSMADASGPQETQPSSVIDTPLSASGNDAAVDTKWGSVRGLLSTSTISSLALHPSQPIFATSGRGQIVIGNYETGQWLGAIDFPEGEVTVLRYSRDGETLLAGGGIAGLSGTVLGIDAKTGGTKFRIGDELDSILAVDMTQNGRLLATGGPNKVVRIYSLDSGHVLYTLRKHTDWVVSLEFSPDGILLASSDRFGGVFVWNPSSGDLFHGLQGHQGMVSDLAWDTDSENLITGCEDHKLRVWNMHHGEMTVAWDAGVGPILSLDHRNDNRIVVGGRSGKATIWSGPGTLQKTLPGESQVVKCGFGIAGKVVLTGDSTGAIRVFDFETERELQTIRLPIEPGGVERLLAFLPKPELPDSNIQSDRESQAIQKIQLVPSKTIDDPSLHGSKITSSSDAHGEPRSANELGTLLRSMNENLTAQQRLVFEIEQMRSKMEAELEVLTELEKVARKILTDHERHIGVLQSLIEKGAPAIDRKSRIESLQRRLRNELSLLEKGTALLGELSVDAVFEESHEVGILRTFRDALQGRIENTTKEIREIESTGNSEGR